MKQAIFEYCQRVTVYKQLRQIAELYPPKEDIHILDLEENKA